MAEYQRIPERFLFTGLSLRAPADALPPGKLQPPFANLRAYIDGELSVREGTIPLFATPLDQTNVHTLARLNDTTLYNGGVPALRFVGAGTKLYAGPPDAGTTPPVVDTGFSGQPLITALAQPVNTPQPFLYVTDGVKQRKYSVTGKNYPQGLTQPNAEPSVALDGPAATILDLMEYTGGFVPWAPAGAAAGVITVPSRVNTTIGAILYDSGTVGNALVALVDLSNIGDGCVLVFTDEQAIVQSVKIATTLTTIQAILYDDEASTGLCTIQPLGGLGTGHLIAPNAAAQRSYQPGEYAVKRGFVGVPVPIDVAVPNVTLKQADFPVDCLVRLNPTGANAEYVRVLSVSVGPDGIQSFRCKTVNPHLAGEAIQGIPACRMFLFGTHAAGEAVVSHYLQNTLTPPAMTTDYAGGIKTGSPYFRDLSTIGGTFVPGGGVVAPLPPYYQHFWDGLDHTAEVTAAKAAAIAEGADLTTPCGVARIAILTAESLQAQFLGVLRKFTGPDVCPTSAYGSIFSFAVVYPSGQVFYILNGAYGANTPTWGPGATDSADRYVPVGSEPGPPPPIPGGGPTPISGISGRPTQLDDFFHLSLKVDQLAAVEQITVYISIDAVQSVFTGNMYQITFSSNDLIGAIQTADAQVVTPFITQQQTVAVPRFGLPNAQIPWENAPYLLNVENSRKTRALTSTEAQLATGNNQWMELTWKFSDMLLVGTDPSRSLATVTGVEIIVQATSAFGPITVSYDDLYLRGSYGADVGDLGNPIKYTYRYRSTDTGEVSNPAPPQRYEVLPRRQRVLLQGTLPSDPQADQLDWFRLGATLKQWSYVGSQAVSAAGTPFNDDYPDVSIQGGETLEFDNFQPWPTTDLPRTAVVNTAGSAVLWLSGDTFNARWGQGSQILINGIPYTLYKSPTDPHFLQINENAGALTNAVLTIPNATLLAAVLPTRFGPYQGFYFAVGDPSNPGQLNWTKGNNPDVTSDANTLFVVDPSTPLQNGLVWDNACYVASTNDFFRIIPDFTNVNVFRREDTPVGKGFWTRWAFCVSTYGPVFLSDDGIYLTDGQSPAISLTDADLYPIFPHNGIPGVSVGDVDPPDMNQPTKLRLCHVDGFVRFDYVSTKGDARTLYYELTRKRWLLDVNGKAVNVALAEEGQTIHNLIVGRNDGTVAQMGGLTDDGAAIPYTFRTRDQDAGDPRREKTWGDVMLKANANGGSGITATPFYNDSAFSLPPSTLGAGVNAETLFLVDINAGEGLIARNFALQIQGLTAVGAVFFLWEPAFIPKVEDTGLRFTDWEDCGYFGAKFMQGVIIEADTGGTPRQVEVQYDGGVSGDIFTVSDPEQSDIPHSFPVPFIAHLVRYGTLNVGTWRNYRARWIWEPIPELVAQWITQPTTLDFPGYGQEERTLLAHMSTVDFVYTVTVDGKVFTYPIPNSGGLYTKTEILEAPNKGKWRSYSIVTTTGQPGVRLFLKDCSVMAKPWGVATPYGVFRPFGDSSRENGGARI